MAIGARLVHTPVPQRAAGARGDALRLSRRLPSLVAAAREIAASVMHGVHGRRRAGVGETFWQFRPFAAGEAAGRIDWRRSARDDRLFVREREWEAAHTVWLWTDLSPSMAFQSNLALQPKLDRALVLGLAASDLLVRGGERVGLMRATRPLAARDIVERFADALALQDRQGLLNRDGLPPGEALAPRTRALLIGDFLVEPERWAERLARIAARGARGHCVVVADPAEEAFPFAGHVEFTGVGTRERFRAGRAESYRAEYVSRLAAHRAAIADLARRVGFTLSIHHTDRPASEALLSLRARIEAAAAPGIA